MQSNHPPNIIKQILKSIEKRLSDHSSNEMIFNHAKAPYENALKDSEYEAMLSYNSTKEKTTRNNRKRKIIWYNPPFNRNVMTKIGNRFLQLIDKHFPKHHKYCKIFIRNTVKVSYSCTKNVKSITNSHNKNILRSQNETNENKKCNCMKKNQCPLNGNCLLERTIYEATVSCEDPAYIEKRYIGLAETTIKKRYANHKKSFNTDRYENETELSKEVWILERRHLTQSVHWKIGRSFNRAEVKCDLCINEKLEIATYAGELLNSKTELISKCRHVNKHTLAITTPMIDVRVMTLSCSLLTVVVLIYINITNIYIEFQCKF